MANSSAGKNTEKGHHCAQKSVLNNNAHNLQSQYDVVISGGGIVGCLMALALAQHTSFSVLLLEANAILSVNTGKHTGFDARVIALAAESLSLLAKLGVDINDIRHQSIQQIHVSDKGHLGQVRLDAKALNVTALGKVVALQDLGKHLLNLVSQATNVTVASPLKISQLKQSPNYATITLSNEFELRTKLLVISDGGQSVTAALAGITTHYEEYGQTAIITNIKTQLPHNNVAYERFTSQGPIAFLPMNAQSAKVNADDLHSMSIVWCVHEANAHDKLALSDSKFLQQLGTLFGDKLGKLTACSKRYSYPLTLSQASPFGLHRAITVGNAAQSLHPIAGQGFNLGIRDVYRFIETIKNTLDPGHFSALQPYKDAQKHDKANTIYATDSLVRIFSNQYWPFVVGRNVGLLSMNASSMLKQQLAKFAMGKRG